MDSSCFPNTCNGISNDFRLLVILHVFLFDSSTLLQKCKSLVIRDVIILTSNLFCNCLRRLISLILHIFINIYERLINNYILRYSNKIKIKNEIKLKWGFGVLGFWVWHCSLYIVSEAVPKISLCTEASSCEYLVG